MTETVDMRFPVVREGTIGADRVQTVDARELHGKLGVGRDFSNWIKARIAEYAFTPHIDYVEVSARSGENPAGGRPRVEYALSLDMAKELAMVENNEIGRATRRYFLACERRAKGLAPAAPAIPQTYAEALRLAADQAAQIEQQAGRLASMAPKVDAYDRIADADGSLCTTDAAKSLQVRPKDLKAFLMANGWIYTRTGCTEPVAYQSKIATGLMVHKVTNIPRPDGTEKTVTRARITPKGLGRLAEEFGVA